MNWLGKLTTYILTLYQLLANGMLQLLLLFLLLFLLLLLLLLLGSLRIRPDLPALARTRTAGREGEGEVLSHHTLVLRVLYQALTPGVGVGAGVGGAGVSADSLI